MEENNRFKKEFFNDTHRRQDSGHYARVAEVINRYFNGKTMLEVGCGMGWITRRLQSMGEDCEGFDIGEWAVANAVCPSIFQADLLDCVKWDKKWEVVFNSNVLSYFRKSEVPLALKALKHIFTENLVVLVQTKENIIDNLGGIEEQKRGGRRTFESWDWWLKQIEANGLVLDEEKHKVVSSDPEGVVPPEGTGRPTLFVLKHAETGLD